LEAVKVAVYADNGRDLQKSEVRFRHKSSTWEAAFTAAQLADVLAHVETFIDAVS
jgi:hypothetical protein